MGEANIAEIDEQYGSNCIKQLQYGFKGRKCIVVVQCFLNLAFHNI